MARIPLSDRCVCCGAYVPEGRQICPQCERETYKKKQKLGYVPLPYWKQVLYLIRYKLFGR